MYIFKNALKCISRSMGRNILLGIIALVIAVSACIGLSIRQAADSAKKDTLETMNITASISFDRRSMMNNMEMPQMGDSSNRGGFDRSQFAQMMGGAQSLTAEEYLTYAQAESVSDFYYSLTASFNGSDNLTPVSSEEETSSEDTGTDAVPDVFAGMGSFGGGRTGGRMGMMSLANSGDFSVVGYSSDSAMTDFVNGSAAIIEGSVFEEGTTDNDCIISEELALYNGLTVGDTIVITNALNESEKYELTVNGIYTSSESNDFMSAMFRGVQDPANRIYLSAAALQNIIDASEVSSTTVTDESTGRQYETAITGSLAATYVFKDPDSFYRFEEEARALGLPDSFTVTSIDVTAYENSLTPLNTLSTMAGWFLLVVLIIGAIILIVLNIFNVRERKYEIGVLTAMGMKKSKVALQFMTEIFIVTMIAIVLGAGIGAASSVPVTNALLARQVESRQAAQTEVENNFGRPGRGGFDMSQGGGFRQGGMFSPDALFSQNMTNYVTEVNSAMNLIVVLELLGIGLLLTLIAGGVSVLFVMRYDPLKILANRD